MPAGLWSTRPMHELLGKLRKRAADLVRSFRGRHLFFAVFSSRAGRTFTHFAGTAAISVQLSSAGSELSVRLSVHLRRLVVHRRSIESQASPALAEAQCKPGQASGGSGFGPYFESVGPTAKRVRLAASLQQVSQDLHLTSCAQKGTYTSSLFGPAAYRLWRQESGNSGWIAAFTIALSRELCRIGSPIMARDAASSGQRGSKITRSALEILSWTGCPASIPHATHDGTASDHVRHRATRSSSAAEHLRRRVTPRSSSAANDFKASAGIQMYT